jgi:hydrophobic/amphiphilic exporter-1 (mainly G- bacteria), HAE1 family
VVRATASVTTPEPSTTVHQRPHAARRRRHGDARRRHRRIAAALGRRTGIGLGIIRQAQSNTLEYPKACAPPSRRSALTLPEGVDIRITSDDATFINGAIEEVQLATGCWR